MLVAFEEIHGMVEGGTALYRCHAANTKLCTGFVAPLENKIL